MIRPATPIVSTRVFANFRRGRPDDAWPPRRLMGLSEFIERMQDPANTVRFFRLGHDLKLESAYTFPPGWFMAAPTFVPRPGASTVCGGYLIALLWGPDSAPMERWIWDSARPLAAVPCDTLGPVPSLSGYCHRLGGARVFKLAQISGIRVLEDERF